MIRTSDASLDPPWHALRAAALPEHHRDPFDRMLVAQALSEDLKLMTADPQLRRYDLELLWLRRRRK